jgi:hypothetical protein
LFTQTEFRATLRTGQTTNGTRAESSARKRERQTVKTNIEQIARRANELSGSMSHGQACYAACRELGVEEDEVASTASIVSAEITNAEIQAMMRAAPTPEQFAAARVEEKEIQKLSMRLGILLSAQNRQNVRRRLRKHGLASEYGRALQARADALAKATGTFNSPK